MRASRISRLLQDSPPQVAHKALSARVALLLRDAHREAALECATAALGSVRLSDGARVGAHGLLAQLYTAAGDHAAAITELRHVASLQPGSTSRWLQLARAHYALRSEGTNLREAATALEAGPPASTVKMADSTLGSPEIGRQPSLMNKEDAEDAKRDVSLDLSFGITLPSMQLICLLGVVDLTLSRRVS